MLALASLTPIKYRTEAGLPVLRRAVQGVSFCPCAALYEKEAGLAFRNLYRKGAPSLRATLLTADAFGATYSPGSR